MKTTDDQNELFVVVDKKDNIIGYRTRKECHSDKSLIHRSVNIIIYDGDNILLQKRSMSKDLYPGLFTVSASGHVDKGESYMSTAKREMKEEIGINIPLKLVKKILIELPVETEVTAIYTGKYSGKLKLNKTEVEEVVKMTPREIAGIKNKLTPMAYKCFEELGVI